MGNPPAIQEPEFRTPRVQYRFSESVMARLGTRVCEYDIKEILGEGGLGAVYRAKALAGGRTVAIKILHARHAGNTDAVGKYFDTAMAATHLGHPNVAQVIDRGVAPDGAPFLVLEYLDGESLQDCLRRVHRLPLFEAMGIAKQVARGLGAAHALGITHRDLKPSNIFLCKRVGHRRIVRRTKETGMRFAVVPEKSFDLVRLLDFGADGFFDLSPSTGVSIDDLHGLPYTVAPEQIQGRTTDPRSDIYALGAVLYEMITGSPPFEGDTVSRILQAHLAGDVVAPSRRFPDGQIDLRIDSVILKCLRKNPLMRFARMDELSALLDGCVTDSAFLRDAHRLPGIKYSGIDLTQASQDARHDSPPLDARPAPPAERTPVLHFVGKIVEAAEETAAASYPVGTRVEAVVKEPSSFLPVPTSVESTVARSAPSVPDAKSVDAATPPAASAASELRTADFQTEASLYPVTPPLVSPAVASSPKTVRPARPRRVRAVVLGCVLLAEGAAAALWMTRDRWMHLVFEQPQLAPSMGVVAAPPVVPPAPPPALPSPAPAPSVVAPPVEAPKAVKVEEPVQRPEPTVRAAKVSKKLAAAKVKHARKTHARRKHAKAAAPPIVESPAPAVESPTPALDTVEKGDTFGDSPAAE